MSTNRFSPVGTTTPHGFEFLKPGTPVDLTNCSREAIHLVGSIQSNGFLLAVGSSNGLVEYASGNVPGFLGAEVSLILGVPLTSVVGADLGQQLLSRIPLLRDTPFIEAGAIELFDQKWEISGSRSNFLTLFNFEHCGDVEPDQCDARLLQVYSTTKELDEFDHHTTQLLRVISGFDQVLLYRFDDLFNGEAIAESKREEDPSYLHLWFPEADVPYPARRVMQQRPVGVVHDHLQAPVPLYGNSELDPTDLDLTHSALRSVSPMCSKYYSKMGVRSSVVVSLFRRGRLWGFFGLWHRSPRWISAHGRKKIEAFASSFMNLRRERCGDRHADKIDQIRRKKALLLANLSASSGLQEALQIFPNPSEVIPSLGGALIADQEMVTFGVTPDRTFLRDLAAFLKARDPSEEIFSSRNLESLLPKARNYRELSSGLLALRLGRLNSSWLLLFRPEVGQSLAWTAEPSAPAADVSIEERLTPKSSFAIWLQEAKGYSREWDETELEVAQILRVELHEVLLEYYLKQHKLQLARANAADKIKNRFLSLISHELRTPINGVLGNAEFLVRHANDKAVREVGSDIFASAKQLIRLVNDVIDASRLGGGELVLEKRELALSQLLDGITEHFNTTAREVNIDFLVEVLAQPTLRFYGDRVRLQQLIENLLSNALKFTPPGGSVLLIVNTEETRLGSFNLRIDIVDSGRGISPEKIDELMQPFTKGDDALIDAKPGMGLGLAICEGLATLMGGGLQLISLEGIGTRACLILPVEVIRDTSSEIVEKGTPEHEPLRGIRVLVAEDNLVNQRLFERVLTKLGCSVSVANNGAEAVALANSSPFDVGLFDIQMPVMDGVVAMRLINEHHTFPIVAASAHASDEDRVRFLDEGFNGFVSKPVDRKGLLAAIQVVLDKG